MLPLKAEGLCLRRNDQMLFDHFSFDTGNYRRIAMMGSTGSGKTTLLKMLAGFIQPDAGKIWVGDSRVLGPNEKLIAGHSLIGYLSQHYELRNNYFVWELLEMSNKVGAERSREVIACCVVGHLLERRTDALSGGERQRVALARILLADPKWLLLDEPFSNLDLHQKRSIMQMLNEIETKLSVSFILVSHDAADLLGWADHLVVMEKGTVLQAGKPSHLYYHPINENVAGLLGDYNLLNAPIAMQLTQSDFDIAAGQKIMFRPEHLSISANESGLPVTITNLLFKGSFWLVTCCTVANVLVNFIIPSDHSLQTGQRILLQASAKHGLPVVESK
ncbi:MAG: ABC transporter ATP-binding protein [Bacteroidetes bacterium]|nr:ABC transporter ATP-binding protein [Bacteroidota bacterium]